MAAGEPETARGSRSVWSRLRDVGPGAMVAAAFIGPGTVTTATLAGVSTGYLLLWTLLFSVLATLVLQEMAARLGLVTGRGLGEAIRERFDDPAPRWLSVLVVFFAVAVGNAAYQTGNLLGGSLGLAALFGGSGRVWGLIIAGGAFALLWTGSYRLVERTLVVLVVAMAVVFVATAVTLAPPVDELARGLFVPSLPSGRSERLLAVALVGTTVVPYNLFLHASAVRERWSGDRDLPAARTDALLSIGLGGLVSMAVVVTAAAAVTTGEVETAADMAVQLEPLLGRWARAFFSLGLFAAGMSSAITAPLAAAYATTGVFGWDRDIRGTRFRAVWIGVLLIGAGFAVAGLEPVPAIVFAQIANGLLLPAIVVFLMLTVNDRRRMGEWANGTWLNVAGAVVVLVAVGLGLRALLTAV